MKNKLIAFVILTVLFLAFSTTCFADEGGDVEVFGLELEKLFNLGSGLLAAILFVITFVAYRRSMNKRLLYVSVAFLLFAVKGFLTSLELFAGDFSWIDPVASFLNFAILLCFFFGVLKK